MQNFKINVLVLIFAFAFSQLSFGASKWTVDLSGGSGQVEFHAIGKPSAIKIHGKGEAPKGKITLDNGKIGGVITAHLASFDTGIQTRNEHMKNKYLGVQKYPEAKLT